MITPTAPNPAPLAFRPPRWTVLFPNGQFRIISPHDLDRLRFRAKLRKANSGGGNGNGAA